MSSHAMWAFNGPWIFVFLCLPSAAASLYLCFRPWLQLIAAYPGDPEATRGGMLVDLFVFGVIRQRTRFITAAKADHENLYITFGRPWKAAVAIPWQDITPALWPNPFAVFRAYFYVGPGKKIRIRMKQRDWDKLILMRNLADAAANNVHESSPTEVFILPRHRETT